MEKKRRSGLDNPWTYSLSRVLSP